MKSPRPVAVAWMLLGLAACAGAEPTAASRLEPLPLDPKSVTVSGLSSGGAMAVQFHVAHSGLVNGVAVLAAPPYFCAEGAIGNALGRCMKDGATIPVDTLMQHVDRAAQDGSVDPVSGMGDDRVWLYRGTLDPHVHVTVADALERYYRARTKPANLVRIERSGAGHNFPTTAADASPCAASEPPYVASCGYDAARALLEHLYGPLGPGATTASLAPLRQFDQRPYAAAAGSASFAEHGWLYVPVACHDGATTPCRLHVVFHGCKQGATEVGDAFVRRSGYLEAAEAGRVVVLFPQLKPTMQPLNPLGCWDWWGYEGADYATKNGAQIEAVRSMIEDLMGRAPKDALNADQP